MSSNDGGLFSRLDNESVFRENEDMFSEISNIMFEMYDSGLWGDQISLEEILEHKEWANIKELQRIVISIRFVEPDVILFVTEAPFHALRGIAITRNDRDTNTLRSNDWPGIDGGMRFSNIDDNVYIFSGGQ
jgi:hypothetical protein